MIKPRYPQTRRSTQRSDPAVVSVETPPRKAGSNDVAASIEYLRIKEQRLRELALFFDSFPIAINYAF